MTRPVLAHTAIPAATPAGSASPAAPATPVPDPAPDGVAAGSPSLVATPPGPDYASPAVFAREQERIFEAEWFAAALVADLPAPGAFRTVTVGRENVLVVRDRRGELGAFLNVCRHRGARLCTESAGSLRNAVRCPYHAWTYALDGRLIAAPNLDALVGVDRAELGLRRVALRQWLGTVWVCLAPRPPDFEEAVTGVVAARLGGPDVVAAWRVDELTPGRRITYRVAANWKLVVENFLECYHCATIHPELTAVLPEFADGLAAQYHVGHGADFGPAVAGFTVDGAAGFPALADLGPDTDRRYWAATVAPQAFVNLVPDHVILHRMHPLGPDVTVVECDWLFAPEVVASGADLSRSVELFDRVNRQDFEACERCQLSMGSRAYAGGGLLVPSEHHIAGFHDWVRARVAV